MTVSIFAVKKFVHVLRRVARNIDADFLHHRDGLRMHIARWLRSRAVHVEEIARDVAQDAFGQMAPARVASAKNEDGWIVDGHNSI
jgi:hypothetical protein